MRKNASFFIVLLVICTTMISCQKMPSGKESLVNQNIERQYKNSLHYITFDKEGRIILASTNGFIARIDDIKGRKLITYGTWGLNEGSFRTLYGIAVDSKNRIYVTDTKNQRLVRIDDFSGKGWKTFEFTSGDLLSIGIRGLCIDSNDKIYVTDVARHRIIRMDDMDGTNLIQLGSYGSGEMQFNSPYTLDIDSVGRIYISDGVNNRIVRIDDMSGKGWITFGSNGNGVGEFKETYGISLDDNDHIIISDGNGRLVKIDDMNGSNWEEIKVTDYAKELPVGLAGIKIDKKNRILYVDYSNGRICRINSIKGDGFSSYSFEN